LNSSLFTLRSSLTFSFVDDNQHHQYQYEDDGTQRPKFWGQSSLSGISIDECGEGFQTFVTYREDGDGEVIDTHRDGKHETGNHTWQYLRDDDLAKCLHRRGTQIECRLIEVRIHLLQSWHHTQNNVWQTEGDMREYHGSIALRNAQRDEEQEERDTDDDVAVEYRNVVDKLDGVTCIPVAQVVDADGCQGSEDMW
jgi:hypothetical protein